MARRAYTREMYQALVNGFREAPGNASHAGRIAGVGRSAAKLAWEQGWPKRSWAPPIRQYLEKEKELIRAERQKQLEIDQANEELARERATKDAFQAQAQEAAGSQAARANSLALANVIGRITIACIPLSERVATELKNPNFAFTPQTALRLFSSVAYVVKQGNEALRLALEIERLRVGEPTNVLKLVAEDLTIDDVASQLTHMQRTLQRAVEKGVQYGADVHEDLEEASEDPSDLH
jgi:hypothetical protein